MFFYLEKKVISNNAALFFCLYLTFTLYLFYFVIYKFYFILSQDFTFYFAWFPVFDPHLLCK